MTKKVENEIIELESDVIELKQEPVIGYSLIEQKGAEVRNFVSSMLSTLPSSSRDLKSIRTKLKKEFEIFENKRKMVKELILEAYFEFEEVYKENIASHFLEADKQLKEKIDAIEKEFIAQKRAKLEEYFNELNQWEWVSFDDVGLKILKSTSEKKLQEEIENYLENIQSSLRAIDSLDDSLRIRVLAKFRIIKDLSRALEEARAEIKQEELIRESLQPRAKEAPKIEAPEDTKIYKTSFTVEGTKTQLKALKEFLIRNKIKFGGKK
jgi:hypothetical protein